MSKLEGQAAQQGCEMSALLLITEQAADPMIQSQPKTALELYLKSALQRLSYFVEKEAEAPISQPVADGGGLPPLDTFVESREYVEAFDAMDARRKQWRSQHLHRNRQHIFAVERWVLEMQVELASSQEALRLAEERMQQAVTGLQEIIRYVPTQTVEPMNKVIFALLSPEGSSR